MCLLSAPTVLFSSSATAHSSEGGEQSTRPHGSDVVVCVCLGGIIAEDWGAGLHEVDARRRLKPPLKQHCALTEKQSTSL